MEMARKTPARRRLSVIYGNNRKVSIDDKKRGTFTGREDSSQQPDPIKALRLTRLEASIANLRTVHDDYYLFVSIIEVEAKAFRLSAFANL